MGRGQAVRRGTLDPVFEGSNPSAPAIIPSRQLAAACWQEERTGFGWIRRLPADLVEADR